MGMDYATATQKVTLRVLTTIVGALLGSLVLGFLFERVGPGSPFFLFGFLNLAVFLWSLKVRP